MVQNTCVFYGRHVIKKQSVLLLEEGTGWALTRIKSALIRTGYWASKGRLEKPKSGC